MEQVLMHICCAPDATVPVLRLRAKGYEPVGFFYDPNIHPKEEYELRLDQARKLAVIENFELIVGPYEPERWLAAAREFCDEPEGGLRCPARRRGAQGSRASDTGVHDNTPHQSPQGRPRAGAGGAREGGAVWGQVSPRGVPQAGRVPGVCTPEQGVRPVSPELLWL